MQIILSVLTVSTLLILGNSPASARATFTQHESEHWTWSAPPSWEVTVENDGLLWLTGRIDGNLYAHVERSSDVIACAAGNTWTERVEQMFRQHRQSLRGRNWKILDASRIYHPKGEPPRVRRQRLQVRGGGDPSGDRGLEVVDFGFVGWVGPELACQRDVRYRETGPGHDDDARRLIKRVLESIHQK
jgi:acyl-CoA synthetase (AMP-forming)/AMP-acid ligase II